MRKSFSTLTLILTFFLFSSSAFATNFLTPPYTVPYVYAGVTYDWFVQTQVDANTSDVYCCKSTAGSPTIDFNYQNNFYLRLGGNHGWYQFNYCRYAYTTNGGATWVNAPLTTDGVLYLGNPQYTSFAKIRSNKDIKYNGYPQTIGYTNANFGVTSINRYDVLIPATVFGQTMYSLMVSPDPVAGGGVASSDQAIQCGVNGYNYCQASFMHDSNVSLQAYPSEGYEFDHWEWNNGGSSSTVNPMTIAMSGAEAVVAKFYPTLAFPLHANNYTPYTAPITSVFDHSATGEYSNDTDHHVTAFNGETSTNQDYYSGTTCYPKSDNSEFGEGFNYAGYGQAGKYYLCYDGHPGYDYYVGTGTDVYSAATGTIIVAGWDSCLGNNVTIEHGGIYRTRYFHLDSIDTSNVQVSQPIQAGIKMGESGNTGSCSDGPHLHFQVEKKVGSNWIPVDPYGWQGEGNDPYTRATNINLWE